MLSLLVGFVLGVAALLFVTENTAAVSLTFLQWHFDSSIAVLVLLAILVGIILTLLLFLPGAISDSLYVRRLRKHNDALAREAERERIAAHEANARLAAQDPERPDVLNLSQR